MPSGSGSGHYRATDTTARLVAYIVDASNNAVTADTVVYSLYSHALNQHLDFNDMTFKATGSITTHTAAMSEIDATYFPGSYRATLDLTAITNLSANDTLIAQPLATTGKDVPPIELRVDQFVKTLIDNLATVDTVVDSILVDTAATETLAQSAAYQGAIWFDNVSGGSAGTTFGVNGTPNNPCSSEADVLTMLTASNFSEVVIRAGTLTMTAADWSTAAKGVRFRGQQRDSCQVIVTDATNVQAATFEDVTVIGTCTMFDGSINAFRCTLVNFGSQGGNLVDCLIAFTLTHTADEADDGGYQMINCRSLATTALPMTFDLNGKIPAHQIRYWSGPMTIANMTQAAQELQIDMNGGKITIAASCTAGTIRITGTGDVVNNGTSTLDVTGLVGPDQVADAVWDETSAHTTPSTMGAVLNAITAGAIADAVWDETDAHVTADTMGEAVNLARAIADATVIDNQVYNAASKPTSYRIRRFATAALASSATTGAANGADSELNASVVTITYDSSNRPTRIQVVGA